MSKSWRFDGTAVCQISVWMEADTIQEAQAMVLGLAPGELWRATSTKHIHPDIETISITSARESTEENP